MEYSETPAKPAVMAESEPVTAPPALIPREPMDIKEAHYLAEGTLQVMDR